jgi:hypothetical protein
VVTRETLAAGPIPGMSDEALRELERRWRASSAVEDEAAWLAARLRVGAANASATRLRAFLGDPAARLALDDEAPSVKATPTQSVDDALERLADAHGVLVHHLFEPPGAPDDPAAHELVARATAVYFGESQVGSLAGRRVGLAELLGDRVDVGRRLLLFPSPDGLLPAAEATAARLTRPGFGSSLEVGYGRAFADPPYGVRGTLEEVARLFDDAWTALVGTWDPDRLVAFSWSVDHLPAFSAGTEWWGSPLWTIAPRDGRPWVGAAASETD